jgi:DNA-directed RNA polymerase alpha subunit
METAQDVASKTEEQLMKLKGMNADYLKSIKYALNNYALSLPIAPSEHDSRPVSDLDLSVRGRKAMVRLHISTIGELRRIPSRVLLDAKNFGASTFNQVNDELKKLGLKLREY